MNSYQEIKKPESILRKTTWFCMLAVFIAATTSWRVSASTNVVVWDTIAPLGEKGNVADREGWQAVPNDLFSLETNPAKASSDPGYYGREYVFKGDMVVENPSLAAMFWGAKGRVVLYSKTSLHSAGGNGFRKVAELAPMGGKVHDALGHYEVLQNVRDEAVVEASFGSANSPVRFSFDKSGIVEVKADREIDGVTLVCPMEYGIVPGFIGDDLIFGAPEQSSTAALSVPTGNLFVGLLKGEDAEVVMTWPKGNQRMRLGLGDEAQGKRPIETIDFENDGQAFYFSTLAAPGIWHREQLNSSFLEKDVPLQWKKPFSAKWKTQLLEEKLRTTFNFKEAKGTVWRGVPGSYDYPVWFDQETAFYHLSKKVPPKGESVIYFLEGEDTPLSIATPVEIMEATLGRQVAGDVLDVPGRKLRTHHRRGGTGVRRACTCGCTEAIQAVFEAGEEVAKKDYIDAAIGDMIYFIQQHLERIDEYRRFADDMTRFLSEKQKSSPELAPFLENLAQIVAQIPQEYSVQQENMKSLEYAGELSRKTIALTAKKESSNLAVYMDLLKAWRGMGGAQDYVVAQCHGITRKLFQQAGYTAVNEPKAVELVAEIRKRCQQCLRNPDGYEIWPNY